MVPKTLLEVPPKISGWKLSTKISLFRVSQTVFSVTPLISAQVRVAYFKMVSPEEGSSVGQLMCAASGEEISPIRRAV